MQIPCLSDGKLVAILQRCKQDQCVSSHSHTLLCLCLNMRTCVCSITCPRPPEDRPQMPPQLELDPSAQVALGGSHQQVTSDLVTTCSAHMFPWRASSRSVIAAHRHRHRTTFEPGGSVDSARDVHTQRRRRLFPGSLIWERR